MGNIAFPNIPIKSSVTAADAADAAKPQRIAIPGGQPCRQCGGPTQRYGRPLGWKPPALMPVWYSAWDRCGPCKHSWFDDAFRCTQVVPPSPPVAAAPAGEGDEFTKLERPRMTGDRPQYAGCTPPRSPRRQRHLGDWPYTIDPPPDPKWSGWGIDRTGRSNAANVSARKSPEERKQIAAFIGADQKPRRARKRKSLTGKVAQKIAIQQRISTEVALKREAHKQSHRFPALATPHIARRSRARTKGGTE
jgi:hypothetical protein